MRITRAVLKKIANRVRAEIKEELAEGAFQSLVFFYDSNLKSITEFYLKSPEDKGEKDFAKSLKQLRRDLSPAAVVIACLETICKCETAKEAKEVAMIPDHPKRRNVVIIEASSRTSEYEIMIEVKKKDDGFVFGAEYYESVPGEGCIYTRKLWDKTKTSNRKQKATLSSEKIEEVISQAGRNVRIDWDKVLSKLADLEEEYGTPLAGPADRLHK